MGSGGQKGYVFTCTRGLSLHPVCLRRFYEGRLGVLLSKRWLLMTNVSTVQCSKGGK